MQIRFASFVYDAGAGALRSPEGEIHLRPQVFELLGVLLDQAPRLVDNRTLIEKVWRVPHVSRSSIQRSVSELRRALGDDAREPRFVATVHRRGYRFLVAGQPAEAPETDPTGAEDDPGPEPPDSEAGRLEAGAPSGSESGGEAGVPRPAGPPGGWPDRTRPIGPPPRPWFRRPELGLAMGLGIVLGLSTGWLALRER